jgi:hypothetical protein|tara:strand:- start:18574 stop:18783 length:210 start_codon:yes stop_codon:yes gene_type:complete
MLIVNDIMDAFTMRRKLSSMVRRTLRKQNGALPEAYMEELLGVIEDLDKNIKRIDSEIYSSWKESGDVS